MIAGMVLRWWSVRTLAHSSPSTSPSSPGRRSIRRGPYRLLRHPSYTGALLTVAGFGLGAGRVAAGAGRASCRSPRAFLRRIRVEERMLADAFPDAWPDLRARNQAPHSLSLVTSDDATHRTAFITGATSGFGAGRRAALRRRLAGTSSPPVAAPIACRRSSTNSAPTACIPPCSTSATKPRCAPRSTRCRRHFRHHRPAGEQRRPRAGHVARAARRPRRLADDDRHQRARARRAHACVAADADRTPGRDRQRQFDRGDLSLRRRQRLRRHEGLRLAVLARPARGPARHRRARDRAGTGHGGNRIHAGAHARRPGGLGCAVQGRAPDDGGRHRRDDLLGRARCRRTSTSIGWR